MASAPISQDDPSLAPWTTDPEAAAILASFTASPIEKTRHEAVYVQTRDEWLAYQGVRVDALNRIWNRHFLTMEAAAIAHNNPAIMDVFIAEPTVQQAVEAACAKASKLRLVEGRAA